MKILKIELQNINSLKSDSTIVIDFENEHFIDVGLYAITGATGAGKTTILDAITIALYHNVPRFNGSKGTLLDVVSHGANDAFCSVTFENNNSIFEGYWGIRLANKAGIILKNPIEKVSLKNLTSGITLADQKRKYIEAVEKVTQLDYTQFLRSVLLAQGDFASFLTAKGPEKGKLLEQITGEQIYKKIGQGILDRKSAEESKLREIQSKINSDDVLIEEVKIELTQKDKELDVQIVASENEIVAIGLVVSWYLKSQELTDESEKLAQYSKALAQAIESHTTELQLLDANEQAEPFTGLIQNFNNNEKSTIDKSNQLLTLEKHLLLLNPEIEHLYQLSKQQVKEHQTATTELTNWLPKFDVVTKLDGQLKSETERKQNSIKKLEELASAFKTLEINKEDLSKKRNDIALKITIDATFLEKNKFLEAVDKVRSKWSSDLTILKANTETLKESSVFITQKTSVLQKTTVELEDNKEILRKKLTETGAIDKEIAAINIELDKNNLSDLLIEKDSIAKIVSNWQLFNNLSEQNEREEKGLVNKLAQQKKSVTELENVRKLIEAKVKEIVNQDIHVSDAQKIYDLEKSISKYEQDRHNLIDGEPCGLCGSNVHPYAENLESIGVSESHQNLKIRIEKLDVLKANHAALGKSEVELSTHIDGLERQINSITEELKVIQLKSKELNVDCDLRDLDKIKVEISLMSDKLASLDIKLTAAQQLQIKLNNLSNTHAEQSKAVGFLKTKVATLSENIKNTTAEVDAKQNAMASLTKICSNLEAELKMNLSSFNYKLPTIETINSFIQQIENDIATYYKAQKSLGILKSDVTVLDTNLENIGNHLETSMKSQKEYTEIIKKSNDIASELMDERVGILPQEITVEVKRLSLQAAIKQLSDTAEVSKKNLQQLLDTKTEKEALKNANKKEQGVLNVVLKSLKSKLETQIKNSIFESKQEIEKALLSYEDKLKFTQHRKQIEEKELRLKTLKETNLKAIEALQASNNFEVSEAESKIILSELKAKRDGFSAKKGEIKEAFRKDQEIRNRNQEVYKKIDAQDAVCVVWRTLFKIIGNSKDAFNVYVQRLTLKHLLDLANVHLYKLNKRYSLKMEEAYKPKEELNFNLIDHYQTDQARLVDTSSGGEKFIISLALALGLSDLASKNVKIDSLFIDEGFGTLDSNTLETVISTLETLQSQGKMIGIISHVENLKERIPTQIQVSKKSNGVSIVEIL